LINIIELVLSLLASALEAAHAKGLAPEIIMGVGAAISQLEKVRGSDVTYQQLQDLRVQPKW